MIWNVNYKDIFLSRISGILDISYNDIHAWFNSPDRFPIILPFAKIINFARKHDLELEYQFKEVYGATYVDYLIFKKITRNGRSIDSKESNSVLFR